ncbi:MAG: hypothetical protein CL932_14085 [Deltaproteobacteria bacterium]|nr:hypothetical protein [Deltaproteobacteria bacterium]
MRVCIGLVCLSLLWMFVPSKADACSCRCGPYRAWCEDGKLWEYGEPNCFRDCKCGERGCSPMCHKELLSTCSFGCKSNSKKIVQRSDLPEGKSFHDVFCRQTPAEPSEEPCLFGDGGGMEEHYLEGVSEKKQVPTEQKQEDLPEAIHKRSKVPPSGFQCQLGSSSDVFALFAFVGFAFLVTTRRKHLP